MISIGQSIHSISKIAAAVVGLFEDREQYEEALNDVETIQDFLEQEKEVGIFLANYSVDKHIKHEVVEELAKSGINEYIVNSLQFLIDNNLAAHISLFLSTLRSKLLKLLKIKNVFIYSSFEIASFQKEKLESLWSNRVKDYKCDFVYLIDKSLKLGIKVQVDNFVEEFSVKSNLLNIEIKLDSIFV